MPNLLIISDNEVFKRDLTEQLALYAPQFVISSENAVPDIILLDEDKSKLSSLRAEFVHTPIFMLLKKGSEKPKDVAPIKYIVKPVYMLSLMDKLSAEVNFTANSNVGRLQFNQFDLRPLSKEIINQRNGEVIKLTEKEVAIIQYLHKIKGRIVTKNELLQEVWGYSPDVTTHTIETHIYRLRQKVEHDCTDVQLIATEDGGYLLKR